MAFSDPQTIDYAGLPVSLPRVGFSNGSGVFQNPSGELKLTISHAYNKRTRRVIRLDFLKTASDPLLPSTNVARSGSIYMVVDTPNVGFSIAELTDVIEALTGLLGASSGAATTKFLGGEV